MAFGPSVGATAHFVFDGRDGERGFILPNDSTRQQRRSASFEDARWRPAQLRIAVCHPVTSSILRTLSLLPPLGRSLEEHTLESVRRSQSRTLPEVNAVRIPAVLAAYRARRRNRLRSRGSHRRVAFRRLGVRGRKHPSASLRHSSAAAYGCPSAIWLTALAIFATVSVACG
jgi:hypothetical protein